MTIVDRETKTGCYMPWKWTFKNSCTDVFLFHSCARKNWYDGEKTEVLASLKIHYILLDYSMRITFTKLAYNCRTIHGRKHVFNITHTDTKILIIITFKCAVTRCAFRGLWECVAIGMQFVCRQTMRLASNFRTCRTIYCDPLPRNLYTPIDIYLDST